MNIIQLQDRLKGIPEEVLIGYVQTPTGETPTYLVLSELERRKVMRDKYAGQQAEQPPVAEQIISESMTEIMPQPPMAQGIATGMPPQGMPPAAPQEMMSESIEEVGIAANPTPNIGQNYNTGGVVGYPGPRRRISGSYVEPSKRLNFFKNMFSPQKYDSQGRPILSEEEKRLLEQDLINSKSSQKEIGEVYFTPRVSPEDIAYNNMPLKDQIRADASANIKTDQLAETVAPAKNEDNLIAQQRQAYYDSIKAEQTGLEGVFGLQSRKDFYKEEREAIQAERDKYAGDKDSALNMALINAGLGIASGTSSNFLENVATGAMPGITSYTQDMKDMRAEDRLFDKEMRTIDRGERAEGRADMTAYKTNELALRKIAATSGLTKSEYATISKDAKNSSLDRFKQVYGDTGQADIFFANEIGETLTGTEKSAEILKRKTKALEELYGEDLLTAMNQRVLANNSGYSAMRVED